MILLKIAHMALSIYQTLAHCKVKYNTFSSSALFSTVRGSWCECVVKEKQVYYIQVVIYL